jgi:uncharacterized delta-60 repeat protein
MNAFMARITRRAACGIAIAWIAASALPARAGLQDGAYDPTFGSVGRTWIDVTSSNSDDSRKLIRLPNGNFFMAGGCGTYDIACAAWLTPSGELATGYGTSGIGTTWFSDFPGWPNDNYGAWDAAAFPDGRVAVAMVGDNSHLALLRADGTGLDSAVGNGAGYTTPPFQTLRIRVAAQQILVAGAATNAPYDFILARYDSSFHLDTSFGNSGYATIAFGDGRFYPYGMTLQRDGKIVVIGSVWSTPSALGIVRFTAGGDPDPDFGVNSDGRYESTYASQYGAMGFDIVADKKGRLVFAGFVGTGSSNNSGKWLVNRLQSGGAVDPSFNGGNPQLFAIFDTSREYGPSACCVALQSDNRIVVAGTMDRPETYDKYFALARFTEYGAFDSSFGNGGQSYGDMSTQAPNVQTDFPHSLVIVPGGIVVGGTTGANGENRFTATKVQIDLLFAADFE